MKKRELCDEKMDDACDDDGDDGVRSARNVPRLHDDRSAGTLSRLFKPARSKRHPGKRQQTRAFAFTVSLSYERRTILRWRCGSVRSNRRAIVRALFGSRAATQSISITSCVNEARDSTTTPSRASTHYDAVTTAIPTDQIRGNGLPLQLVPSHRRHRSGTAHADLLSQ